MIYTYPMDLTGCGSYRILWPAALIGENIRIVDPGDDAGVQVSVGRDNEVLDVSIPTDCDTVLVQRPTSTLVVNTLIALKRAGIKVIVEVDDDLMVLSPRHPSWELLRLPGNRPDAFVDACRMADRVIASTKELLRKYGFGHGVYIPNYLPPHFFAAPDNSARVHPSIGWPGSISTHPDDLSVLGNALTGLGVPVRIVGPSSTRGRTLLGVDVDFTGSVEFKDWIPAVSQIHTGIAPLALTPFNKAKSSIKPIEMAVARVPFVCSPTDEYVATGAGLVARDNKPREWAKLLRRLLNEPGLREHEIGRNYEVAQKWALEDHLDEWRDAWFA